MELAEDGAWVGEISNTAHVTDEIERAVGKREESALAPPPSRWMSGFVSGSRVAPSRAATSRGRQALGALIQVADEPFGRLAVGCEFRFVEPPEAPKPRGRRESPARTNGDFAA